MASTADQLSRCMERVANCESRARATRLQHFGPWSEDPTEVAPHKPQESDTAAMLVTTANLLEDRIRSLIDTVDGLLEVIG